MIGKTLKYLGIFIFVTVFVFADEMIMNKMVVDYGNFLNIEGQKEIHNVLEYIYDQTGIYVSLVTVENTEKIDMETSILDYVSEINKKGINEIIILVRDKNKYHVYLFGGVNNKEITRNINELLNSYKENQQQIEYFYSEFNFIIKYLSQPSELEILKKYNTQNLKLQKTKKIVAVVLVIIFVLAVIIGLYMRERRKYLKKIGAIIK